MQNENMKNQLKEVLGEQIYIELETEIKRIEGSLETTQNHYGDYMAILSRFGNNKRMMATMLIVMGANQQGIISALRECKTKLIECPHCHDMLCPQECDAI